MSTLLKLTWVELKLFAREPMTVIFTLVFPVLMMIVLAGVFGNEPENEPGEVVFRGVGPIDYYIPAYIGLTMAAMGLLALPTHLSSYREVGFLRRLRASSVPVWALFASQVLVTAALITIGAALVFIATILIYDIRLPEVADLPRILLAYVMGLLVFAAVGIFIGSVLKTARAAQAAGLSLFFLMFILSGSGPPRDVLTDAMQRIGDPLPLTHVIILLQDPWLGFSWSLSTWLIALAFLVVPTVLALRLFRWE